MIQSTFLHEVASFVFDRVEKVILNDGEFEITDFTVKQVIGSKMTINYIIPNGSVATVMKIDLANAADMIVSSNEVNVPISADTLMIQAIDVKEVIA